MFRNIDLPGDNGVANPTLLGVVRYDSLPYRRNANFFDEVLGASFASWHERFALDDRLLDDGLDTGKRLFLNIQNIEKLL